MIASVDRSMHRRYGELEDFPQSGARPVHKLVEMMQLKFKQRGMDVNDLFAAGDRLRSGRVSRFKFRSTLNGSGLACLTEEEVDSFVRYYGHPRDPTEIDYKTFCFDIEVM